MRRCPQCGAESPDQAKFCGNCGFIQGSLQQPLPASFSEPGGYPASPPAQQFPYRPGNFSADNAAFTPVAANQMMGYPQAFQAPPQQPYIPYGVVPPLAVPPGQKKRRGPGLLGIGAGIVLVLVLIVVGWSWLRSANAAPQFSVIAGQPAPGQVVTFQGAHFPAGSKLGVVVDSDPLILLVQPERLAMASASFFPLSLTGKQAENGKQAAIYSVTTGNDGTFTVKIRIPASWKAGSKHTIVVQVIGANPKKLKPLQYQFTVA